MRPNITYVNGLKPCPKCGGNTYYVRGNLCVGCIRAFKQAEIAKKEAKELEKEKRDKMEDADYRIVHCYLRAHHAPQFAHSALERLLERAGIKERLVPSVKRMPEMTEESVRRAVKAGKKQIEIAVIHGVTVRSVGLFMQEHGIKPSYSGIGTHGNHTNIRKVKVKEERIDPEFPVPVKVVEHGYGTVSQASL